MGELRIYHDARNFGGTSSRQARKRRTPPCKAWRSLIARACKATRIVEFGTSMGISTIYLAAALRDNGGGHLISSELEPAKVARARANLDAAGLGDLVDIREDDALDTLKDVPTSSGKSSGMKICEKHSYSRWSWPGACWNRSTVSAAARSIPCTRIYASASA